MIITNRVKIQYKIMCTIGISSMCT